MKSFILIIQYKWLW